MEYPKRLQRLLGAIFIPLLLVGCNTSAIIPTTTYTPASKTSTPTLQSPTVTDVVTSSPTTTNTPESPAPSMVLFEEDFDDGQAQNFTYIAGNWNVLTDETGNRVFDGDNTIASSHGPLSAGFGSTAWTDYAIEYRIRILDGDIWLSFRNSDQGGYVLRMSLPYSHVSLYVSPADIGWQTLMVRRYHLERNVWYHVRVEAQGEMIRVFINDKLEIEKTNSQVQAGDLAFGVLGGTGNHLQFDDLRVTGIEQK